jgi:hypothetical protein
VFCGEFPWPVRLLLRPLFAFQNWNDKRIARKELNKYR